MTDALNVSETYTYYNNGNLKDKTDRLGYKTTTTYNHLNQPLKVTNTKDGSGKAVTYTYTYDAAGRLTTESETGGSITISKTYTYNKDHHRTKMVVKKDAATVQTTNYTYDSAGRLLTVNDGSATPPTATYAYDANGNRISQTLWNGVITEYEYNKANLLTKLTNKQNSTTNYSV